MPKQLNVNLAFTADTSHARAQLQELQKQLSELTSGKSLGSNDSFVITKELQSAVDTASKLKMTLKEATNASTGQLDLTKFQESMNKSQMSIGKYKDALLALGPSGQQAFANLASSITQAEIPMRRTNALVKEFGVTLMNAARWQFSSSVLHGLMGAMQGAYGYAQDLNRSLTDIAIVTGNSVDNMAAFAEQANKSAQALSTSTLAYTDAALIYYQQGLDDEQVRARTETTLKMSNVTRQSAEEVSSYMTAIWNNFAEGSDNLEIFADKITALGAATASSSKEIATGLQQFAALGSSLGLNYDDAVAALATVVAQTRQSASTVGNSFRTLFQRIESLKLGETLEDGVGLTKYSLALEKVGVQVLDVNGKMRDMHDVIQDLGAVWGTLGREQQNALAQTVGGVRNSNTLIAWMDNFEKFQENLGVAANAEGTLEDQAEIYAESWEAAQKRVKAAWQAIYQDLIDENFFIDIANSVEDLLSLIDNFIDAAGGLKGVLLGLTTVIISLLQNSLAKGLDNALFNLKMFTKAGQESYAALKQQANQELVDTFSDSDTSTDALGRSYAQQGVLNNSYLENVEKMTDFERQIAQIKMDQQKAMIENIRLQAEQNTKLEQEIDLLETSLAKRIMAKDSSKQELKEGAINDLSTLGNQAKASGAMSTAISQLSNIKIDNDNLEAARGNISAILNELDKKDVVDQFDDATREAVESIRNLAESGNLTKDQLNGLIDNLKNVSLAGDSTYITADSLKDRLEQLGFSSSEASNMVEKLVDSYTKAGAGAQQLAAQESILKQFTDEAAASFDATQQKVMTFSEGVVAVAGHISSVMMAINSLKSALDAISNPDLTGWEKFRQVTMSLSIAIPMLIKSFAGMKADILGNAAAMLASEIATRKNTVALMELGLARAYANGEITTENALEAANVIWKERQAIAAMEDSTAHLTLAGAIKTTTAALWENITAMGAWLMAHPMILAIGLALGAVAVAIKAIHDASPEAALEAANDRLKDASKAAKEASEAYDELKSTLDEYKQVKEDINNIKDSDERRKAISEENEKILEMLDNLGDWSTIIGDLQYDSNGLISLTEEQIKALENDKAREESLAKQLELQEKINVNTANQDVENSKYSGKKISVTTGKSDAHIRYDEEGFSAGTITDETANVAKILAEAGLDLHSGQGKIDEVLSKYYDPSALAEIKDGLEAIRADEESSKQFEEMQASQLQTIAENNALEKQSNQLSIDQAQREMGDNLSIGSLSRFEDVQVRIAEEWNALDADTKEAILKSKDVATALQEAFGERLNIEEANNEALKKEREERQAWRTANLNSVADQMTNASPKLSIDGTSDGSSIRSQLSSLSDEDLKIAATLELDKFKSVDELKAAIEEVKQQTEEDRRFQIEMKRAEDLGLDMDDWKLYVDYLQSVNEELAENDELAAQVATANMRLNRGVESLIDNFDEELKVIETANKEGNEWSKNNIDYAKALTEIQTALADIGNVDLDTIRGFGEDFVKDNFGLIQEAAQGDIDAIDELIKKIAEANLMEITPEIKTEAFETDRQALIDAINETNFNEIEIGTKLGGTEEFYDELNRMIESSEIGAFEINKVLASIGYTPIVETMTVDSNNVDEVVGNAEGEMQFEDMEGQVHTVKDSAQLKNWVEEHGQIQIPIIKGSNGGNGQPQVATAANLSKALGSSTFAGGTGAQTSPTNRNNGNKNKPKSSCFTAGTLVTTLNNNYKNIENINIGDIVLSYNEKTKKNEYSKVLQTMIHNVFEDIYNLFVKNDKLSVTGNHKFLVTRNNKQEWIQASEIKIGDLVLLADGTLCEVSNIAVNKKFITVYNFEVSNTHNYYVGKNRILAHNKGKGKSGGKEKERQKKEEKELQEKKKEEDRYHDLEEAVDDLNTSIERLDKNKERAYGKNKLNYMNLESKKLKEQIDLTKKYIKEIEKYQKTDRKALEDKLKDIGMTQEQISSQFDANGVLKSYEDLFSKIQDHFNDTAVKDLNDAREEYNKQVKRWNDGELDEDTWKDIEEKLKKAEDIYKKQEDIFKEQVDALKKYEDTTNKLQEKEQELLDQQNELFDKALEIVSTKIELKLSIADSEQKYLEWVYDNIGDSADRAADKIALLGRRAQESTKTIAANAEGLRDMLSEVQAYYTGEDEDHPYVDFKGIDMKLDINNPEAMLTTLNQVIARMQEAGLEAPVQTIVEKMNGYRDALMDQYNNLREINNMVTENMVNAFEDMMDSLSKNLDKNDHFQTLMEYHRDIRDLLGQEELGLSDEEMRKWDQQMLNIKRDAAQVAQANYNAAHEATEKARKEYEEAVASGNQFAIDRAREVFEAAEAQEHDFEEEFLDRWEQTLQMAKEIYEKALEDNEKAYQRSLGGGILPTLDKLQEQFDMQKEINDLHLDDYEKYKKLGDLQANINKQLANNPNVKVQGKLKDLMNDVNNKMAAGVEISEGEATVLEKRLQLLQAEDQLMAARNAKSAVRMTRDNEGNFSYTYTADTSKIEEAQQNYADKFYDLLDYERQYSEDTQAAILQSYKEFLEKRNDIINDETLTQSEKEVLLRQLEEDMKTKVGFYTKEMEMITSEMGRFKDKDWSDMDKTLGRLLAEPDDFETKFEDTTLGKLAPAWSDAEAALDSFINTAKGLLSADLLAHNKWAAENEISMKNVGTTTAEYGRNIGNIYQGLKDDSTEAKDASKDMAEQVGDDFETILDEGRKFDSEFGQYLVNLTNNLDRVIKAINGVTKALSGVDEELSLNEWFDNALGGDLSNVSEILDKDPVKDYNFSILHNNDIYQDQVEQLKKYDKTVGLLNKKQEEALQRWWDQTEQEDKWGNLSNGTDMLHTRSKSGGGLRSPHKGQSGHLTSSDITDTIIDAFNSTNDFEALNKYRDALNRWAFAGTGSDELVQNVYIDASFPNVQSHNEIELAFNNLINSATQYVNRKK